MFVYQLGRFPALGDDPWGYKAKLFASEFNPIDPLPPSPAKHAIVTHLDATPCCPHLDRAQGLTRPLLVNGQRNACEPANL